MTLRWSSATKAVIDNLEDLARVHAGENCNMDEVIPTVFTAFQETIRQHPDIAPTVERLLAASEAVWLTLKYRVPSRRAEWGCLAHRKEET